MLDGLEPLQLPQGDHRGVFEDQAAAALLTDLAHGEGRCFCLATSRESLVELEGCAATESLDLETLPVEAGAALLHSRGADKSGTTPIAPDDAELQEASREVKGHALTLHILGLYLAKAHHGDIRKRDTVELAQADARHKTNPQDLESPYGHAFKAMAAYERWLQGGPEAQRQLALLRLLGLFDRPADPPCLAALRAAPVIAGLTEPLADLAEADWNLAVSALEDARLVQAAAWQPAPVKGYDEATARKAMEAHDRDVQFNLGEPAVFRAEHRQPATGLALDAHPLLREYFGRWLGDTAPEAGREGNRRLYEHIKESVPYWPEGEAGLQPLYQAVGHGCRAGFYQETCDEVYRDRIGRRGEAYAVHKLGLFGADLVAVARFFDPPWTRPVPDLAEAARAWLLNEAAVRLRALGRLAEALEPMRVSGEMYADRKEWAGAAVSYGNLSELALTLGQVAAAVADAGRAVEYADRSGNAFQRIGKRTALADALHQAGEAAAALARFEDAEARQAERQRS